MNTEILIGFILIAVVCFGYMFWRRTKDKEEAAEYKRQSDAMIEADRRARNEWAAAHPGEPYPGDIQEE